MKRSDCLIRLIAALLVLFSAAECVHGQSSRRPQNQEANNYPPEIPDAEELVYRSVDGTDLKAWIFQPDAGLHPKPAEGYPVVAFFFGGGWRSGNPNQFVPQCRYLKSRGVVAITCDYRVASRHQVKPQACVSDAKAAIRWIRTQRQKLGINPQQICAAGGSAGGHLAASTSLLSDFDETGGDSVVSCEPNALALFNPALMLAPLEGVDLPEAEQKRREQLVSQFGSEVAKLSPIHHIRKNLPPTVIFHGTNDTTVGITSIRAFDRLMDEAGNHCELYEYAGAGHGFFNLRGDLNSTVPLSPQNDSQLQFHRRTLLKLHEFLAQLGWIHNQPAIPVVDNSNVRIRGHLLNSLTKFRDTKKGHVAFLGGSITEMDGYRPNVERWLKENFPQTEFTFTNAGIASTCSLTGAFRLERDVLSAGPVDLLCVEFAVNDDQDAHHSAEQCTDGMEGIIRHVRQHNPCSDIVMIHFVNPEMLTTIQQGEEPLSSSRHEQVARHYGVTSVYLSKEVAERIADGRMTWDEFGGTHPGPAGNRLAADLVISALTAGWTTLPDAPFGFSADSNPSPANQPTTSGKGTLYPTPHAMPAKRLSERSLDSGKLLPLEAATNVNGWTLSVPEWDKLPGSKRDRFTKETLWWADAPGAELSVKFQGTAIGAYLLAGPDAGGLEYRIDDGPWQHQELFHAYSTGLHYPRSILFANGLPRQDHVLYIRVSKETPAGSKGQAARILGFGVN